jgi:5-methylcytosine-specific restriction endonuclease McrA
LAWRRANREKANAIERDRTAKNRAAENQRVSAWRAANPEWERARVMRRRARRLGAAGADYTTDALIAARVDMWGGLCRYCGKDYESIDHRIPLARGGSHWPANLVPACMSCNSRKGTMTESEFLAA